MECEGQKEGEGDRAGWLGCRPDREVVLGADGGGGEATTAEVESPCSKGHGVP